MRVVPLLSPKRGLLRRDEPLRSDEHPCRPGVAYVQGPLLGATGGQRSRDSGPFEEVAGRMTDLLLINPAAAHGIYGSLGDKLARGKPFCLSVQYFDAEAAVTNVANNEAAP